MSDVIERIEKGELTLILDCWGERDYESAKELLHLAKFGQQMQWVSAAERLPELGEEVIVLTTRGKVTALSRFMRYEGATEYFWDNNYPGSGNMHLAESVTHWMPLPPAPKGAE